MNQTIPFFKMHGCGNDYIFIDCTDKKRIEHPDQMAPVLSDRHYGIGGDGLVLIEPSASADFKMRMFNADGSEGNMCGNAIRCLGKYVYESHLTSKKKLSVETKSGIRKVFLHAAENQPVKFATVHMGSPLISYIEKQVTLSGQTYSVTALSMGNPHAILFTEDLNHFPLSDVGPLMEKHTLFPEGVNVSAIKILNKSHIRLRVWERGSGETLACGTAACASAMACILKGFTNQNVLVSLPGGNLQVRYHKDTDTLYLTGECTYVYRGEYHNHSSNSTVT